jgi:hypothetical protein
MSRLPGRTGTAVLLLEVHHPKAALDVLQTAVMKIQDAIEGRATAPPVLRNVRLAIRLGFELPRGSLGLVPSRRIR